MSHQRLFNDGELRDFLVQRKLLMESEIEEFDQNRLLSASTEELTEYFYEKYGLDPVRVLRDEHELDQHEVMVDRRVVPNPSYGSPDLTLPGIRWTLRVRFEGSEELLRYQPSRYSSDGPPIATAVALHIVITSDRPVEHSAELVRNGFFQVLNDIEQYLESVNANLTDWLVSLRRAASAGVQARKQKLVTAQEVAARTGFKLKQRADAPKTFAAPEVRRKMQPVLPPELPGSTTPFKSEPTLADVDYDHILAVMSSMAIVLERSPRAFATMDEESLRFLFLVPLNSHYEGQATGETFNFEGKTDILIRAQNRTIFIAECKVWGGPMTLTKSIHQLLGYTSWRDTKTAIVIFNRNQDFSGVVGQIRSTVEAHPNFKKFVGQLRETEFRFVFKHRDDTSREFLLTVLAFNVSSG